MSIGAIIQARRTSTRLPDKVCKPLPIDSEEVELQQVIRRVQRSRLLDKVIVATTTNDIDQKIADIAQAEGAIVFRGSEHNVLERYYQAAKQEKLDTVVRITSDCPCTDSEVVDYVIEQYQKSDADFMTNGIDRTFPLSTVVEVMSFKTLEKTFQEAESDADKEHVCIYIYKTRPEQFKIVKVGAPSEWTAPWIRLALDTKEDYALITYVYEELYKEDPFFSTKDIIRLFKQKPWLANINSDIDNPMSDTEDLDKVISFFEKHDLSEIVKKLEAKIER